MRTGSDVRLAYEPWGGMDPCMLEEHEDQTFAVGLDTLSNPEVSGFYLVDSIDKRWPLSHPEFLKGQGEARAAVERGHDKVIAADLQAGRKATGQRAP
jgi:hypothetical protein